MRAVLAAGLLCFAGFAVQAQDFGDCREDVARLCPGIAPGGGRIAACFREHAGALSPRCKAVIAAQRPQGTNPAPAPDGVPAAERQTYDGLAASLSQAEATWQPSTVTGLSKPEYFTDLLAANSNAGEALLRPQAMEMVKKSLDSFRAMGLTGVKFALQYPLLTPGFPHANEYLAFYKQVAAEAHARGLKIMPHVTTLFGDTAFSPFQHLYTGLTPERFTREYRDQVRLVLRELKPDYLGLITEPDTLARLTGLDAYRTPAAEADLVNAVLDGTDRGRTKICAGSGSWSGPEFARALAARTSIDAVCIHIYPIQGRMLDNAAEMARIARATHKQAWIDEAWLYKTTAPGGGNHVAAAEGVFGNDVYAFWQPLDAQFFAVVNALARREKVSVLSFYWSRQFFAYLPAGEGGSDWRSRSQAENRAWFAAMSAGTLSPTGETYRRLIAAP
jgi:hypothetical protein